MFVPARTWFVSGVVLLAAAGVAMQVKKAPATAQHAQAKAFKVARPSMSQRFDHVIVIVQENRTVDNMFNGFPGADTVRTGNRFGQQVALQEVVLEPSAGGSHRHSAFVLDYDNGKMDGFDWAKGPTNYVYVRQADVQNYWTLGQRFTLADEVFQMNMGPSLASHVYLISGQGGYPWALAGNAKGHPEGCYGNDKVDMVDLRTPFPGLERNFRACVDFPTIFDELDNRGISWGYYAADYGFAKHLWTATSYVKHLSKGHAQKNVVTPETRVVDDIQKGKLPQVSYVVPEMSTSDHPHHAKDNPLGGPLWVAAITNAVGASAYWNHTLILVTWDDWGGFYDHVAPPIISSDSYGFRTPLLIVSAYPKAAGAVDHTKRSQASVVTAIESVFGLNSLGQLDALSDDLSADFNFNAAPEPYGPPLPAATPKSKHKCNGACDAADWADLDGD
jgi:phospholipase C